MSSKTRFDRAFRNARVIPFSDTDKFILFSDCHRGDNSGADDFANNRNIYYHALKHYFNNDFTYCELGDGDELWENLSFSTIFETHQDVYELMRCFYLKDRLHLVWGNHDMIYRNKNQVKKNLHYHFDRRTGEEKPLFPGIEVHEALILKHEQSGQELFLCHGHQADWMNYIGWRFNRFMVRVLWRPLQGAGISDPTSPAKNYFELKKIERLTKKWIINSKNQFTITGHTHRPRFPEPGDIAYFNDGSCVHPRCITGLEIENGFISLIKWQIATTDDGVLKIVRVLLEGPQKLIDYKTESASIP